MTASPPNAASAANAANRTSAANTANAATIIVSSANPRVRRLRGLIDSSRERRREQASVLEGIHLVRSWIERRGVPDQVVVAERGLRTPEVAALLAEVAAHRPPASGQTSRVLVLADRVFDRLGTLPTAPPILAVVTTPSTPAPLRLDRDSVVLDRIQDPGNVGAILRSVAAAGITQVATTPGTAWCWSPKVLRAAMGGHFALEIHESVDWSDLRSALRLPLAGTWAHGGSNLYDQDLRPACVWVFGNEGEGIDTQIAECVDWRLAIPQSDQVESLNVAAAVAICLFEQRRQRLTRNR